MKNCKFMELATEAGYSAALVSDFLDQLGHGLWQEIDTPTLELLEEYKTDCEDTYNAQVRWDASCR